MKAMIDFDAAPIFGIPMADGSGVHEGMLIEGPQGWGEFSPLLACADDEASRWLTAAVEGGTVGWPDSRRGRVPIAVVVGAVDPSSARRVVEASGCLAADVAVGTGSLAADADRVAAVRDAFGPQGRIRLSGNGTWGVDAAVSAIAVLVDAAGGVDFVADPCGSAAELGALRGRVEVPIASGPSCAGVVDVVVLRSGPLGGVRRALRVAERLELPCVVASSGETSIGLAAGLALAGALPELRYACALGTVSELTGDLVAPGRSLRPVDGHLPVAPTPAAPSADLLRQYAITDSDRADLWRRRLRAARGTA
ncbi:O-succinylbenzoate synthase [Mycobacterium yunnanensis]|uniref:O-succinylbenzoate synthase n=1 Tax=Mycobacterium yunnanensis TaxID=368477 RepID=A0A9X2Z137_9MYCO|nr:enolase C-terminal domain-like protein [Mycobacterium yunnanensis]MCV7420242.1 O-succinylbenzoate synthase [Mycobacterium yunnanensis]